MGHNLDTLIDKARRIQMSLLEKEEQRRSFAYGTAKIENDNVTRETINRAAEDLTRQTEEQRGR